MKIKTWILSILLTCGYLYGGITGKVVGVITDEKTGNPLIGCNIILQGTSLGAATDLDGAYIILNIPPGTYTVKTLMIGYASSNITNVIVRSDLTTTIDVSMKEETIEGEEVTVVAERPLAVLRFNTSVAFFTLFRSSSSNPSSPPRSAEAPESRMNLRRAAAEHCST